MLQVATESGVRCVSDPIPTDRPVHVHPFLYQDYWADGDSIGCVSANYYYDLKKVSACTCKQVPQLNMHIVISRDAQGHACCGFGGHSRTCSCDEHPTAVPSPPSHPLPPPAPSLLPLQYNFSCPGEPPAHVLSQAHMSWDACAVCACFLERVQLCWLIAQARSSPCMRPLMLTGSMAEKLINCMALNREECTSTPGCFDVWPM